MSTINMRDQVMQVLNKAHSESKGELYKLLSLEMRNREELEKEITNLKQQIQVLKDQQAGIRALDEASFVKKTLAEGIVDEELFDDSIDTPEKNLYFQETFHRLYEAVRLHLQEGTMTAGSTPVLLVARDISGSSDEWHRFMAKVITTWVTELLTAKYGRTAEVRYVTFNTGAEDVSKEKFFNCEHSWGTIASSSTRLLNTIADEYNYETNEHVYTLLISDGDNLTGDNGLFMKHLGRLEKKSKAVWYVETSQYEGASSICKKMKEERTKNSNCTNSLPNLYAHILCSKTNVLPALKNMFKQIKEVK